MINRGITRGFLSLEECHGVCGRLVGRVNVVWRTDLLHLGHFQTGLSALGQQRHQAAGLRSVLPVRPGMQKLGNVLCRGPGTEVKCVKKPIQLLVRSPAIAHQRYFTSDISLVAHSTDVNMTRKKIFFKKISSSNMIFIYDIIVGNILLTKGTRHVMQRSGISCGWRECGRTCDRPWASTSDSLACQSSPWKTKVWSTCSVLHSVETMKKMEFLIWLAHGKMASAVASCGNPLLGSPRLRIRWCTWRKMQRAVIDFHLCFVSPSDKNKIFH